MHSEARFGRRIWRPLLAGVALVLAVPLAAQGTPPAEAPALTEVPRGPVPAWAEMLPLPPPTGEAIDIRLRDVQLRFGKDGIEQFQRSVFRANSAEALQLLGRMVVVWAPGIETPTVHRLVIRRGSETIDVLARQSFSVLRREKQLESAVIDGQLTGFLQIADLRQGDEVEFIVSVKTLNPLLEGHHEALLEVGNSALPTGRMRVRATWPDGLPVRWKEGQALPAASQGKTGSERWMTIDASNFRLPEPPADAPGRYGQLGVLGLSDFADWQQVSALFAPVYDTAASIGAGTPLAAEADRIAAASADPVRRAELALALVQTDVRYVADLAGLGGYKPVAAEAVWRDRLGDCKGKTVLLLGLLRRLGIAAEPALVSVRNGDAVGGSLPMPGRFDHVLVRATIAGRTYWLDGTRLGDSRLDRLAAPPVRWALPLTRPGSGLVSLPPQAPTEPLELEAMEFRLAPDLGQPAKVKASMTYRGDQVSALAAALSLLGPERTRDEAREFWRKRWRDFDIDTADAVIDRSAGTVRIEASGAIPLEWSDGNPRTLTVPRARVGINITPERKAGPFADAPVAVEERYGRTEITMVLPRAGFTLSGDPIDAEAGGIRYSRRAALEGTRLTMTSDIRSAAHEVTLAEAKAADIATDKLWDRKLILNAPEKPAKAAAKPEARPASKSSTPAAAGPAAAPARHEVSPELRQLGQAAQAKAATGAFDEALGLIDAAPPAVQADPDWAVLKVMMLMQAGRVPDANRVLTAAVAKAPRNPQLLSLQAQVLAQAGRLQDALIPLDRAILISPDDAKLYELRGQLRREDGDLPGAAADFEQALALDPDNQRYQSQRLSALIEHDKPAALKAIDAAIAAAPDDAMMYTMRARVLAKLGRTDDAKAALARSIAIEPTSDAYALRFRENLSDGPEGTIADAEAVVRMAPGWPFSAEQAKRVVALPNGYARVSAVYQAAHAKNPANGDIIAAAEVFNDAAGKPEATLLMLDTGLTVEPGNAQLLNNRCFFRAQRGLDADKALADCEAALKLAPGNAGTLDSRAVVWLQKGAYQKAIADYDAAMKLAPRLPEVLYGRGLAKRQLKLPDADADFAEARKLDPRIDATFARYKLPFALPPAPPVAAKAP